jgi:hypothetical protein
MTKHEFLIWAVPFFTLTTIVGAALSVMRLLSKRSKQQHNDFADSYFGTSTSLAFRTTGLWRLLEKGAAFVYIIAVLGLVFAVTLMWVRAGP